MLRCIILILLTSITFCLTSQTKLEPNIDDGQTKFENITYGGSAFLQDSYGFILIATTIELFCFFDGCNYKDLGISPNTIYLFF